MDLNQILAALPFNGFKTILAGVGLAGLGIYQISQGQLVPGVQSLLAGLAAIGVRHAISKPN